MAEREYPIARVRLYEAGQSGLARYEGFGRYDVAAELVRDREVEINIEDQGPGGYGGGAPAAMCVSASGLNSVICRPTLDTTQSLGLGHFSPVAGTWKALKGLGLGQEVKLYQSDGTSNKPTGVESNFLLPRNPMFAVSLWRAEPGVEHDWSQPPYTEVHFGIGEHSEWAIALPYGGPLFVMRRVGAEWTRIYNTEKTLRLPSLEGHGKGQRMLLWVGVLREKLVLSTDGFTEDVWAIDVPGGVSVSSSKVTLWHNAGQWMFSVLPMKMTAATLLGPAVETGYLTRESAGAVSVEGRMLPVWNEAGQIVAAPTVSDDTEQRLGLSATERSWKVEIAPHLYRQESVGTDPETGETVAFETWQSPEWLATQVSQEAEITPGAEPVYHDLSADVLRVDGEHAAEKATGKFRVALDNQLGQHKDIREYRRVSVALGWQMSDGQPALAEVIDGNLVEPPLTTESGGTGETRLNVLDPMLRLRDEKADGRTPVFDGWPVLRVFRWVLGRCGIPETEQDLEDTGTVLSSGRVEAPVWQVEPGRAWLDFLQEVARFDYNAAIWFDEVGAFRKTCKHCRVKRTAADVTRHDGTLTGACDSAVRWEMYTRGKMAPDPKAAGEVLDLRRTRKTLGTEEYANYVAVSGIDGEGRPVQAVTSDPASLYDPASEQYVGWRKMEVWELHGYSTQDEVNRLAQERLNELSARPEHVVMVTPLLPEARIGQVLRINGGETLGVNAQRYRIEAVRHRVERHPEVMATTTLEARWLG